MPGLAKRWSPPVGPGVLVGSNAGKTTSRFLIACSVTWNSRHHQTTALVDSGCEQSLVDP
uniref:Uncharacterized protein n=1 Tax=Nothobranchius pienaari TaxID=704102 RepID=A0A1A8MM55_9TELE